MHSSWEMVWIEGKEEERQEVLRFHEGEKRRRHSHSIVHEKNMPAQPGNTACQANSLTARHVSNSNPVPPV